MKSIDKQAGWSMWSLIVWLGLVMLFATVGMKLVPVYFENSNVKNAMEVAFENAGNPKTMTKSSYVRALTDQLYLDGDHQAIDYRNDVFFKRGRNKVDVTIAYERIVPLFFNINFLLDFEDTATAEF